MMILLGALAQGAAKDCHFDVSTSHLCGTYEYRVGQYQVQDIMAFQRFG